MSGRTTLTLANLRCIDLLAPSFVPADLPALAEMIAKENRFNGATPGLTYSVAEHCSRGADVALRAIFVPEGVRQLAAAYFLAHDLRDSIWKDDTTPKKNAIAERLAKRCGVTADAVTGCFDELEDEHEMALQDATGLLWPPPMGIRKIVKHIDMVMFVTEWRDLMALRPADHPDWSPYADIVPLRRKIEVPCWPWDVAKRSWMRRAAQLLPALQKAAGK